MRSVLCADQNPPRQRLYEGAAMVSPAGTFQRLYEGAAIVRVPDHIPIKSKVYGVTYVFQCPMNVWEGGKGTISFKQWKNNEYRRHMAHAAREGNSRAMQAVLKRRTTHNKWQAATRGEGRRIAREARNCIYTEDELDTELDNEYEDRGVDLD